MDHGLITIGAGPDAPGVQGWLGNRIEVTDAGWASIASVLTPGTGMATLYGCRDGRPTFDGIRGIIPSYAQTISNRYNIIVRANWDNTVIRTYTEPGGWDRAAEPLNFEGFEVYGQ